MRDYENQVESAFIAVLQTAMPGVEIRHWRDASKKTVYPAFLVYASQFSTSDHSPSGPLIELTVEISARTYLFDDEDRAVVNQKISDIRDVLFSDTVKTDLDNASNLTFHGVDISGGKYESDNDNENIANQTVNCFIAF